MDERGTFIGLARDYYKYSTDAPPQYGEGTALFTLGHALGYDAVHLIKPKQRHHNMYLLLDGESTFSRKTTSQELGKDIYSDTRWLPNEMSPEAQVEVMANQPEGVVWMGEFSRLLKGINGKGYMAGFAELFNDLFTCPSRWSRKLRGKENEFIINKPYLSLHSTITPTVLKEQMTVEMFEGGLMARWLIVHGEAHPQPIGRLTPDALRLNNSLRNILDRILDMDRSVQFEMSDEALKFYNDTVEKTFQSEEFKCTGAFAGRYEGYVITLADLYLVSEAIGVFLEKGKSLSKILRLVELLELLELEEKISEKNNFNIPKNYTNFSNRRIIVQSRHVKQAYNFVLPCLKYVKDLSMYVNLGKAVARLREYVKKNKAVSHSQAMRGTGIDANQLTLAANTLNQRDEIFIETITLQSKKRNRKYQTMLYKWNDGEIL
jgi:hypothetical protein